MWEHFCDNLFFQGTNSVLIYLILDYVFFINNVRQKNESTKKFYEISKEEEKDNLSEKNEDKIYSFCLGEFYFLF